MKNLRNKLKTKKGITLVALIITIIVLLILAGVVINMTVGNNGIINKAQGAVDMYKNSQEKEEIEIAKYENMIDGNRTISDSDIEAVVNRMILKKYPVGSIYCSVSNTNPGTFIGGTWVRISQGRVLMGASDTESEGFVAGTTKNAGLPNITGSVGGASAYTRSTGDETGTGALYDGYVATGSQVSITNGSAFDRVAQFCFDASRSSSIYGSSDTVQPPAYIVYMWQRTE